MNVPTVEQPQKYRGLYVYDFGEWAALGYTAEEIALLLESEAHRGGKIYKIHNAWPDGRMELLGVAPERFQTESGLFFYRARPDAARTDFEELRAAARETPPPSRTYVHLADRGGEAGAGRYATCLIYPAEFDEEVGRWLLDLNYQGGDWAEGGVSHVSNYYAEQKTILEREQLWSRPAIPSRSREEVLSSVRRAVQR